MNTYQLLSHQELISRLKQGLITTEQLVQILQNSGSKPQRQNDVIFETFPAPMSYQDVENKNSLSQAKYMYSTTEPLFQEDPGLIKIDSSRRPLTSLQAYEDDHQSSCTIFEQINYP